MKRKVLSLVLALGLALSLMPATLAAEYSDKSKYTQAEAEARGFGLSFSKESLDFGTAEYREGEDLFPTQTISVTNTGSEPLMYRGWAIDSGDPVELVESDGFVVKTIYEEVWTPQTGWRSVPIDARWLMPGSTATFIFRCTAKRVRSYTEEIYLDLDFEDSAHDLTDSDVAYRVPLTAEVTSPDYGNDISVDKESLEFVWDSDGAVTGPQTVTVTHTGKTDLTYRVEVRVGFGGVTLSLAGGHSESEYERENETCLSPGEKCVITLTPEDTKTWSSSNTETTLYIDAKVLAREKNPGSKEDERHEVDLLYRRLVNGGYQLSAWDDGYGTITPSYTDGNYVLVPDGGTQTFTATPDEGYMVAAMYVDGKNVGRLSSYTFTDVRENHSIKAVFKEEGWPYYCLPNTGDIWANHEYTGTITETVSGVERTVYVYPEGTEFYIQTGNWIISDKTADGHEAISGNPLTIEPGVTRNIYALNASNNKLCVVLQGEPNDPVFEPTEPTEQPSSWAAEQVNAAVAAGIVPAGLRSQYTTATTRAEFCALAVELYETVKGAAITERVTFTDTTDENVEKMAALGVVTGVGDGTFQPDGALTREAAATMLARLSDAIGKPLPAGTPAFNDAASIAAWASEAVGRVQAGGIMSGNETGAFDPLGSYTREQSIMTMYRLYEAVK